ncbi:sigma-70 family RNA polymerase sigma factor [Lentisphaera profundi]|uniref:Sigma-70 family RNA polymerase sigma factor n=1 Tax=Lentisphaera profundi TaxID=1658616 RepID=A0ABY7VY64_9BACT|nr:sigma-70 family RNA polymerase sigma factor [Lentisphaera profundi]WDE99216.1 sigma-70 family RNA polymerase sigma factor [Lentisphaera profundi]
MPNSESADFIELMSSFQGRLYGLILSLVADPDAANDILQDTNLILWTKAHEFQLGTSFKSWSFRIASFQVMAWRQKKMRDPLIFSNEIIQEMMAEQNKRPDNYEERKDKMETCLAKLPERQRDLIKKRYGLGSSIVHIAEELQSTANSIRQVLFRARTNLTQCVKSLPESDS